MQLRYISTDRQCLVRLSPKRPLNAVNVGIQLPPQPIARCNAFTGIRLQLLAALAIVAMAMAGNTADAATVSNQRRLAVHNQAKLQQLSSVSAQSLEDLGSRLPVCLMDQALTNGYYVRGLSSASVYWDHRGDATVPSDSASSQYRSDIADGGRNAIVDDDGIRNGNVSSRSVGSSFDRVDDDLHSSGCRIDIGPPVPNNRAPKLAWISLTNYIDWQAEIERKADLELRPHSSRCRVFITHQPTGDERSATTSAGIIELPRQSSLLPPPFIWTAVASRLLLLGRSCDGRGGYDNDGGRFPHAGGLHVSLGLLRGLSICHVARLGAPVTLNHRWAALIAQDPRYDALLLPQHQPCLDGVNYTLRVEAAESGNWIGFCTTGEDYDYFPDVSRHFELDVQVTVVPHENSCRRLCMNGRCAVVAGTQIHSKTNASQSVTFRYEALSPAASGCDPEAFVGFVVVVRKLSRVVVVT